MAKEEALDLCSADRAGVLDNWFRRLFQNPKRILAPLVRPGMTVLDYGCGPGYFTLEAANGVGPTGKVIAVDLQQGMLDLVAKKLGNSEYRAIVELHRTEGDSVSVDEKCDLILLFYVLHEIRAREKVMTELKSLLKQGGMILVSEPTFHVNRALFERELTIFRKLQFIIQEGPRINLSRTVILR